MMRRTTAALALSLALAAHAAAQDYLIRNGTILAMDGSPPAKGDVLVRDGMIAAVGTVPESDAKSIPAGRTIDATGRTVMPGFFAAYSQVGMVEVELVGATNDTGESPGPNTAQARAEDAYNPLSEVIPVTRMTGVTTALIAPAGGNVFPGTSAVVTLSGTTMQEALVTNPAALHIVLGEAPKDKFGGKDSMPSTRMGTAAYIRGELQKTREYADQWKRYQEKYRRFQTANAEFPAKLEAWKADKSKDRGDEPEPPEPPDPPSTDLQREAMVRALNGDIPAAFHANRLDDIETMLRISAEFNLSPVLIGGTDAWKIASKLAEQKVPVILQPTAQPDSMEAQGAIYENARILAAAGVRIALMTGDTSHNVRNLPFEAAVAVAHGLPHEAALAAITSAPAEIWRVSEAIGSLKPGLKANIIVVDGDPLQPSSRVELELIAGDPVALRSRQTDLAEKFGWKPAGE